MRAVSEGFVDVTKFNGVRMGSVNFNKNFVCTFCLVFSKYNEIDILEAT